MQNGREATLKEPGQTVLIIDDDECIRDVITAILGLSGFKTIEAEDGARGLSLADEGHPAMILCDGSMPGLSGLEVIRRLRAQESTAQTPVIMMSGHIYAPDPEESSALRMQYLQKPFTPSELVEAVRNSLLACHN